MLVEIGRGLALARAATSPPLRVFDFSTGAMPTGATLARSSTGTYFDSSGVLKTAGVDVARFDYGDVSAAALLGLLVEPQRTNHCPDHYPRKPPWGGTTFSLNARTRTLPDGTAGATPWWDTTGGSGWRLLNRGASGINAGDVLVISQYQIKDAAAAGPFSATIYDYTAGGSLLAANVTAPSTTDWDRIVLPTLTVPSTPAGSHSIDIRFPAQQGGVDDTPHVAAWGTQVEVQGAGEILGPTSLILTSGGIATRSADVLTLTSLSNGTWNLTLETPNATYAATVTVTGGGGYVFDWNDFAGAVAANERHVKKITAVKA